MKDDEIDVTPSKEESKQINDPKLDTTGASSESKKNAQ
jgi:hypothetical protein